MRSDTDTESEHHGLEELNPASGTYGHRRPDDHLHAECDGEDAVARRRRRLLLTDTLGAGLTPGTLTAPRWVSTTSPQDGVCTLPTGTVPGTYTFEYTATVDSDATNGTINVAVPERWRSDPSCTTVGGCETDHPLGDPNITASKSSNPASGNDGHRRPDDHLADAECDGELMRRRRRCRPWLTDTLGAGRCSAR
ncbi:hypothetical protein [Dokdonella sp.]|uniref:hypothetical protein n=1 Tax=Dokdonella sp. TaxID=2291710 RepID=UPI0035277D0D